jgi:two-component system OmpR family response regulator
MTDQPTILVVDDEQSYRDALAVALEREGFLVELAANGVEAIERFDAARPSLVLLDVMLPQMSGIDVCRELRSRSRVPIIMVTARNAEIDAVVGLEIGADDYVSKPFRMEEVLARLRALIRRASGQLQASLRCGGVTLDPRLARVTQHGAPVKLTTHEYRVLAYLMHHCDRIVSQGELTEHIYAQDFDRESNTVEVFVARLRRKLGASCIETVRGLGYRLTS